MQTNRRVGIVIIVIGLLLIISIIYFGFLRKPAANLPGNTQTSPTSTNQSSGPIKGTTTPGNVFQNHQTYDLSKEAPHTFNANDLSKMAMAFAERIGSFSSQSDYGNFTDLKIFMTPSMQDWADKTVADYRSKATNNTAYYGITTTAVTSEIKSFDDKAGTAKITVNTERRESADNSAINVGGTPYRQKIDFNFLKVNGDWLIDSAYWQK